MLKKHLTIGLSLFIFLSGESFSSENLCYMEIAEYKNNLIKYGKVLDSYRETIEPVKWVGSNEKNKIANLIILNKEYISKANSEQAENTPIDINGLVCEKKYYERNKNIDDNIELIKFKIKSISKAVDEYGHTGQNSGCVKNNNCINEAITYRKNIENPYAHTNSTDLIIQDINNRFQSLLNQKNIATSSQKQCNESIANNYVVISKLNTEISKTNESLNASPWIPTIDKNIIEQFTNQSQKNVAQIAKTINKNLSYYMDPNVSELCVTYYNSSQHILNDRITTLSNIISLNNSIENRYYLDNVCVNKFDCQKRAENEFNTQLKLILTNAEKNNKIDIANIKRLSERIQNMNSKVPNRN